jgi:drug/metabolite transporter (DMT)-like permease
VTAFAAPQASPVKAMIFMLAAVAGYALVDASAKWLTAGYGVVQILFFGRIVGPVFALWLAHRHGNGWADIRTRRLPLHIVRTVIALCSIGTYFIALKLLPLAEAISIGFSAPLFMAILSIPLLGEKVGPRRWAAILVGFVGVIVIIRPGMVPLGWGAVAALGSGILYAFGLIISRKLAATESLASLMFWFSVLGLMMTGALLPFDWRMPVAEDLLPIAIVAILTTIAQLFLTQAFRYGEVSLIAPLEYTALVWGSFYGWLIWGELPDALVFVGAGIMIASGIYLIHREHRLGKTQPPIGKIPTDT